MKITLFDSCRDVDPKGFDWEWEQLAPTLSFHRRREGKDGDLWSPTEYQEGATRGNAGVLSLSALVLDFDSGIWPQELANQWGKWEYLIHSTFSHSPQTPKWRAIFPLTDPVPVEAWGEVYSRLCLGLGGGQTDPTCKDPARIYFLPSAPPGAEVLTFHHAGAFLSPDAFPDLTPEQPSHTSPAPASTPYARAALEGELTLLRNTFPGERNNQLNRSAFALGQLVAAGVLNRERVERALLEVALAAGLEEREIRATIRSGIEAGLREPRPVPEPIPPQGGKHKTEPEPQPKPTFHSSDLGNSERLAYYHGEDLRFCWDWGRWLIWDGQRWRLDTPEAIFQRAKETVRGIYREAAEAEMDSERKELARHAMKSEARERLRAMIDLAESEPGIPIKPEDLDSDPWSLNCLNGTLDLRTGILREHRREDLLTKRITVAYDPAATCPTWLAFLDRIFDGNQNVISFLQRAIGYSLTGDTSEQSFFLLWGGGQNGKSTFLATIRELLADYSMTTSTETLLLKRHDGIPNDLAALRGARFVSASETEDGRRLAESLVKQLTGGENISARFLHAEFFEYKPEFKIFLATNHKPTIKGTDKAIWRRIRLIPFTVTIPEPEQDKRLTEKLRKELPGILAWAVRGCLEWQRNGLGVPEEVKAATEEYQAEQDVLAAFLNDCCVTEPHATATAKDLYSAYLEWTEANGERPENQRSFGSRLSERGFRRYQGPKGVRMWKGLGLRVAQGCACCPKNDLSSQESISHSEIPKKGQQEQHAQPTDLPSLPPGESESDPTPETVSLLDLAEKAGWPKVEVSPGVSIGPEESSWRACAERGKPERQEEARKKLLALLSQTER